MREKKMMRPQESLKRVRLSLLRQTSKAAPPPGRPVQAGRPAKQEASAGPGGTRPASSTRMSKQCLARLQKEYKQLLLVSVWCACGHAWGARGAPLQSAAPGRCAVAPWPPPCMRSPLAAWQRPVHPPAPAPAPPFTAPKDPPPHVTAHPSPTSLLEWHFLLEVRVAHVRARAPAVTAQARVRKRLTCHSTGTMHPQGIQGSDYEHGVYLGKISFPETYPFKPPSISIFTPSGEHSPLLPLQLRCRRCQ